MNGLTTEQAWLKRELVNEQKLGENIQNDAKRQNNENTAVSKVSVTQNIQ